MDQQERDFERAESRIQLQALAQTMTRWSSESAFIPLNWLVVSSNVFNIPRQNKKSSARGTLGSQMRHDGRRFKRRTRMQSFEKRPEAQSIGDVKQVSKRHSVVCGGMRDALVAKKKAGDRRWTMSCLYTMRASVGERF